MEDWLGITKIATDPLGRAQNVQYPDGKTVSYTYGKAGERTSITYPDGRTVYYGFDEQVRLSELRDGDSVITYGYDAAGRLAEKHFPNGLHTDYRYDSKGQIQELVHTDREGILDRYTYQYDLLGNKTEIEKHRRGLEEESGSYKYGYDPLGRLNEVTKDSNLLRNYSYDAFGNRTRLMERGKQTTYVYNNVNQLLSRVDAGVEETYTYDKRGNLSQITANGKIQNQYMYGALNRLEQAVNGKGEAARYQYNGLGHRVGKVIVKDDFQTINEQMDPVKRLRSQTISPEKQIQYTIDLTREYHNLLQKEEDNRSQTFLWDGNVAGMLEGGKDSASYYLQDELGSPLRLADGGGAVSDSYGYDEFGQDLYGNQRKAQPFGYTGYQRDDIAETYYAQARLYTPIQGRFSSEDIIKGCIIYPDTLNQYIYCWNNPIIYVDNDGEFLATIAIGAGIGGLIGGVGSIISDISKGQKVDWGKAGKNAIKGGAAGAIIGTGVGAVSALSAAGASTIAVNTTVAATAGASFRAGADIVTSIKNKEMTISNPNRYVTSAVSAAVLYNSFRLSPRSSSLGIMVQGASDFIAGDLSSFESYAGAALSTTLISKYISNPTQLLNLLGVALGTGAIQLVEMAGGIQQFSVKTIGKEIGIAVLISLIAGKLGNIEKLKEILGEDEWGAILDGLRRRIGACNSD